MKAAFLDLVTLLNGVFVGSSSSIALAIGSVPVDSLYCIVSCAIVARFRKACKPAVWGLRSRQCSTRTERVVIHGDLNGKICTHHGSCPRKVLGNLNLNIAKIAFSGLPLSLLLIGVI